MHHDSEQVVGPDRARFREGLPRARCGAPHGYYIDALAVVRASEPDPPAGPRDRHGHAASRGLAPAPSLACRLDSVSHGVADELDQRRLDPSEYVRIDPDV